MVTCDHGDLLKLVLQFIEDLDEGWHFLGINFFFFAAPCRLWDLSSPTRD